MLDKEYVLAWDEIQKNLFTDNDGRIFGVELDLFNNHKFFYIRYPDNSELPIMTDDIYTAIDVFNGKRKLDLNTYKPIK